MAQGNDDRDDGERRERGRRPDREPDTPKDFAFRVVGQRIHISVSSTRNRGIRARLLIINSESGYSAEFDSDEYGAGSIIVPRRGKDVPYEVILVGTHPEVKKDITVPAGQKSVEKPEKALVEKFNAWRSNPNAPLVLRIGRRIKQKTKMKHFVLYPAFVVGALVLVVGTLWYLLWR